MKTVNDFKVENGVAILENVAYSEEAKVVDEFLKNNTTIKYASVTTKDKRFFELKNGKLTSSKSDKFINPYFNGVETNNTWPIEVSVENVKVSDDSIESRLLTLERKVNAIDKIIDEVSSLLNKR